LTVGAIRVPGFEGATSIIFSPALRGTLARASARSPAERAFGLNFLVQRGDITSWC
jgi:hypothetical protein